MAAAVVTLFTLGLYMTSLDYYDPWYRRAPHLHRSFGVLVMAVLALRLVWRWTNPLPAPPAGSSALARRLAPLVHRLLYLLLCCIGISGYLISTADGRSVEVFDWFAVPAVIPAIDNMEDYAGLVHLGLAITMISAASLHALAALKHHFLDKDQTLRRMLGITRTHAL
jgi:cytochrome b561